MEDGLAKYCAERHCDWSFHFQTFMMAYRLAVHDSTGHARFRNTEMRIPVDLMYETQSGTARNNFQDLADLGLQNNAVFFTFVRKKRGFEHRRQKQSFDKKIRCPTYKVDDLVLIHSPVCKIGQIPKLKSHWSGPFRITRVMNDINFVIWPRPTAAALQTGLPDSEDQNLVLLDRSDSVARSVPPATVPARPTRAAARAARHPGFYSFNR